MASPLTAAVMRTLMDKQKDTYREMLGEMLDERDAETARTIAQAVDPLKQQLAGLRADLESERHRSQAVGSSSSSVAESAPITNGKIEKKFLSVEFGDDGAFDPSNADHVNAIMHNHQSELAGAIIPSVFDYLGQMGSFPELSQSLGGVIISYADRYLADDFKEQVKNLNQEEGEIKQGRATVTVDKLQMICDELLKEDGRIKPALIALLKNGRKQLFKTFKKLVREEYGVTPVTVGQKQAGIIYDENRCLTPASDVFFSADGIFGGDGDGGTPHDFLSVQIKLEQLLDTESADSHRAQSDAGVKVVTLVMVLIEQSLRAKKAKAKG